MNVAPMLLSTSSASLCAISSSQRQNEPTDPRGGEEACGKAANAKPPALLTNDDGGDTGDGAAERDCSCASDTHTLWFRSSAAWSRSAACHKSRLLRARWGQSLVGSGP